LVPGERVAVGASIEVVKTNPRSPPGIGFSRLPDASVSVTGFVPFTTVPSIAAPVEGFIPPDLTISESQIATTNVMEAPGLFVGTLTDLNIAVVDGAQDCLDDRADKSMPAAKSLPDRLATKSRLESEGIDKE
jgi:hypothetical protein